MSAWTRDPAHLDIISVMTATLLGSAETIAQAVCGETPGTLWVESERCQILAVRLESQSILVLIAPTATRESEVRRAARILAARISESPPRRTREPEPVAEPARKALPPRRG